MAQQIPQQDLDMIFRQMGMAGQTSSVPAYAQSARPSYMPSRDQVPMAFQQYEGQDPAALEREGPLRQFMRGMGSPVTATLRRLGVGPEWAREEAPKPQTLGEGLAYGAGAMLTFAGLLLPKIGPMASLAAAKAVSSVGIAGKGAALATSLTKSGMIAGTMGAHRAWTEEEPIGQEVLKSMAWGMGLGAGFHGLGLGLKKMGVIKPTMAEFIEKSKGDILSITAPKTVAEARGIGKLLAQLPGGKIEEARDKVVQNIIGRKTMLPSHVSADDVGLRVGPYWNKWKPEQQVRALMSAFKTDAEFDTIFRPVMKLAGATKATQMPFRGKELQKIKQIISATKATDMGELDTAGMVMTRKAKQALDMLTKGKDFGEQWKGYTMLRRSLTESSKGILTKYNVKNLAELSKADLSRMSQQEIRAWGNNVDKYAKNHALLQDVNWQVGNRIQGVLNRDPSVALPTTKQVNDRILSTVLEQSVKKQQQRSSGYPKANVELHPKLQNILDRFNDKRDKKAHGWAQLTKPFRDEWDNVLKELKQTGQTARVVHRGVGAPLYVPPEISGNMVDQWLAGSAPLKFPSSFASVAEAEMLMTKPLPFVGTHLTPIWRLFGKAFSSEGRIAVRHHAKFTSDWLGKADGWMKGLGLKGKELSQAGERIGKVLEADMGWIKKGDVSAQKKFIAEFMKVGKRKIDSKPFEDFAKQVGLSPKELKVAYEMKKSFDQLFKAAGLDPEKYITAYLPRARELTGQDYQRVLNDMQAKGLKTDEIKNYLWVHGMARDQKGSMMNYTKDAFRAYTQYVSGLSKKIHYDEFFQHWDKGFKKVGMSQERREVFISLRNSLFGQPTATERMSDQMVKHLGDFLNKTEFGGARPTAAMSSLLAELQYMGGIGANPFTVVKNLTQKMLAMSSITDSGNPLEGLRWIAKAKLAKHTSMGKAILRHDKISPDRVYLESLDYQQSAIENFLKKSPVGGEFMAKGAGKARDLAFKAFKWSDKDNVQDTFLARMMYLMEKKNAPLADAVELATSTTMATQFMYGFDSPMLYKGAIGRQLGIFMSWPLNWAQMLYEQGTTGDMHRALATVATMAIGVEMLNMSGLNFRSVHPVNVARGTLPIAMLEGEDSWPLSLRTASAGLEYMRAVSSGDPVATDLTWDRFKQRLRPMIPFGIIGGRTLDFVDVMQNEWKKYDNLDRLRYETTAGEATRSIIGPTNESFQRVQEWQMVSEMDSNYRKMRRDAIESFMDGDYERFERMQEQLVANFGRWIAPEDIRQELELREMTARERQLTGLPASIRDPFLAQRGY